jgi:hypothetical protein
MRWTRPAPLEHQVTVAATLDFPTDFLRGTPSGQSDGKPKLALQIAPAGHAVRVIICEAREAAPEVEEVIRAQGFKPVLWYQPPGGNLFAFAAGHIQFPSDMMPEFSKGVGKPYSGAPGPGEEERDLSALMLLKNPDDGEHIALADVNGLSVRNNFPVQT